jgi:hypothetical protein
MESHISMTHGFKDAEGKFHPIGDDTSKLSSHQVENTKQNTINHSDAKELLASKTSSTNDWENMSEKDLIKFIKNGSKEWKEWERNDRTESAYAEIERRNKNLPEPEGGYPKIFRDDPDAVSKLEQKVEYIEKEKEYWKNIIKFPHRDYNNHSQLGDAKWYETSLISTKLRETKKKLEGVKAQQERGTELVRKPTYKGGSKRFYYSEEPKEDDSDEFSANEKREKEETHDMYKTMGEEADRSDT